MTVLAEAEIVRKSEWLLPVMIDAQEFAPLDVNAQDRMQTGLRDPQVAVSVQGEAVGPAAGALDQLPAAIGE